MDFCHFPLVCYGINHLGSDSCSHQKFAASSEMGFTKHPLQVNSFPLSLATSIQLNNDIKDPFHGVRPDGSADLGLLSLGETTMSSN